MKIFRNQMVTFSCGLAIMLSFAVSGASHAEDALFKDGFESGTACWWSQQSYDLACPPSSTVETIDSTGGSVELPGTATVTIPSGAFADDTIVRVEERFDPGLASSFYEFTSLFEAPNPLSALVVIDTGIEPPITDTVDIVLRLTDAQIDSVPTGRTLQLFAMVLQEGGQEIIDLFDAFPSIVDTDQKTLTTSLPTGAFATGRLATDGRYRAILVLSIVDAGGGARIDTEVSAGLTRACEGAPVACPLASGCSVTSPFSPARTINGTTRPHNGTDFRAPVGTRVLAPESGVVERSYSSTSYGETIIIRHTDGSATLLAHLSSRDVQSGEAVTRGQQIGLSGNTGRSTAPHLHMEYVASGPIIQSPHRIDPEDCLDSEPCTGPNCGCCLEFQGCSGETGCVCGNGCCCCPVNQACSTDWTLGCVTDTMVSCNATDPVADPALRILKSTFRFEPWSP